MAVDGTVGVNYRQRKAYCEARMRHAVQQLAVGGKVGVELPPPDIKADDEQSHNLEVAVAVHKLLHPYQCALHEELKHLFICAGIAQPIAEVLFRYAVHPAVMPLRAHRRSRQADARKSAKSIDNDRQQQEERCPAEQRAVACVPEKGQRHAHKGVQHEYVSAPDEHQMDEAYEHKYGHAAVKQAETCYALGLRMAYDY